MNWQNQVLLAAGDWVGVVVFLITAVVWLINFLSNKIPQNPPAPRNRPQPVPPNRGNDERLQKEISIFLEDAAPRRDEKRQENRREENRRRNAPSGGGGQRPPQKPPANKPKPKNKPLVEQTDRRSPGSELAERKGPGHRDLGSGVRTHVQEHMSQRIDREVAKDLPHDINAGVTQHLGQFSGARPSLTTGTQEQAAARPVTTAEARGLIELLNSPGTVRNAILINEVLSKPKALRRS